VNIRIPKRLTIETVYGCNARCTMCPIDYPAERKKQIMTTKVYKYIIDSMAEYTNEISMLDLFGLGEPLLDPQLFSRIEYAKSKGFKSIGISTNAHLLTDTRQKLLFDSGIDTIIFSIDGINKETHEGIRKRVNFDRVVNNCLNTIRMRDKYGFNVKFVVRFIRQPANYNQWDDFKRFWLSEISPEKGDFITLYDMHSWGGKVSTKEEILKGKKVDLAIDKMACHHLDNLIVLADGSIPLCSEDWLDSPFRLGNVKNSSPIELFNSDRFNRIRKVHAEGNKGKMSICNECTVLHSEPSRIVVKSMSDKENPVHKYAIPLDVELN